ncbi:branched-chain amino acid ABC transporter permease [Mumia sp. Pv 4-285]|uniref:branched-chain amino acid ABC transporter permease n=1 Tax=Mumia qirimensis TaxID=3234852 RepID=UPI00351D9A53
MTTLAQMLMNGLALSSVYALVALGFTVIFRASHAMNFAHGSLIVFGGLVVARLHDPLGFWLAVVVAALATAGLALVEAMILRASRRHDVATLAIMTIGFNILLTAELARQIGIDVLSLGDPWGSDVVELGGVTVAQTRLASLLIASALIGLFFLAFRFTRWGLAMRASSMDREAAALMGVRQGRLELSGWAIAGALAAVAAVFIAAFPSQGLDQSTGLIALACFPAAIIGGMGNPAGALLGSLAIGITEAAAATYQSHLTALGSGLPVLAPYVVMVAVLLVRPQGLLGTKESTRV